MRATRQLASLLAFVLILWAQPVSADGWDLIYLDRAEVTLCQGCGWSLGWFGLLANTGAANLEAADVFGATFQVNSSIPELTVGIFVFDPGPVIFPILPGEVVGNIQAGNEVLLGQVLPGEQFRNTHPAAYLWFDIERSPGSTYVGPVFFDVTMLMGGYMAMFTLRADVSLGPHAISFPSAARVTAVPIATAARPTTWGTLKKLYR